MAKTAERKDKVGGKPKGAKKAEGSRKIVGQLVGSLIELHGLQGVLLRQLKKKA